MLECVQLTPAYPPDISGVGDYAALLSGRLKNSGLTMATLVAGGASQDVERRDAAVLAEALGDARQLLLHFSGYGYSRRGLCQWLVDGVSLWKTAVPGRRLVTMFHEVFATGPIWRSSFWTAGAQRRIALNLAGLSDAGFVSSQGGHAQLARLAPALKAELLPVFSNMGELEVPKPLLGRSQRAVVFGGKRRRSSVYTALAQASAGLTERFSNLGIVEIIDIGPRMDLPQEIGGCTVRQLGELEPVAVSSHLSEARLGLLDYPGHVFTKSGIAAAYFAHGLPVVNTSSVAGFPPDLQPDWHFLRLETFLAGLFDAQAVANSGHTWYQPHGLDATAEKFRASLT